MTWTQTAADIRRDLDAMTPDMELNGLYADGSWHVAMTPDGRWTLTVDDSSDHFVSRHSETFMHPAMVTGALGMLPDVRF